MRRIINDGQALDDASLCRPVKHEMQSQPDNMITTNKMIINFILLGLNNFRSSR
jgi:hypothetical protein